MNLADKLKEFSAQNIEIQSDNQDSRVLLIDGLNSYLRCFCSTPTMNDNGEHVGGFTGFLRSIGQVIRILKPSRCVIIFDGKGGSVARREIFTDYKSNRKTTTRLNRAYDFDSVEQESDNRKKQLIQLIHALSYLPVSVLSIDNVEADDVIAYLANLVTERGGKSYIMSNDKDFLQLISESVSIYNPIKKKIYTVETVVDEYNIHPTNFMIYRTIDGDKSDNIPGVKGVGIASLLKNFPELKTHPSIPWEHIYTQCEEKLEEAKLLKKKNAVCTNILNHTDIINRNMSLMRLDDQHISNSVRNKVLGQFDIPINNLNKLGLTQLFVRDRLVGAFNNYDEWISTTFVSLTRYSKRDN
jgi:DNA polymerase-1